MDSEDFNGIRILRPRRSSELKFRQESETHLRSRFSVGVYRDRDSINAILQHQFGFYAERLTQTLPVIASSQSLSFLLFQYEQSANIDIYYKSNQLSADRSVRWRALAPKFRRALKYLIERIVLLTPNEETDMLPQQLLSALDEILICAEELVELSVVSDQTYGIAPEATTLEIFPPGERNYYDLSLDNAAITELQNRVFIDTQNRDTYVPQDLPHMNVDLQEQIIGTAFKNTVGVSYHEALQTILQLIDGAQPAAGGPPIPSIHRDAAIQAVSTGLGFPSPAIDQVLSGFSISKESMEKEGREIWKPKQEYRALRRGFFEVPHPIGSHLTFSKAMARECLMLLLEGVIFGKFPREWRSPAIEHALAQLSNKAGDWFEGLVLTDLEKLGISGIKSQRNSIGTGSSRLRIPPEVGEIDYLGYIPSEKLLIVGECKLTYEGYEPKYFRDTLDEFVLAKKSYVIKFRRKIEWVRNHLQEVCAALESTNIFATAIEPTQVAAVLITFYPSVASYFISDLPCVSITEFMMDYENRQKWPYDIGIWPVGT